ncbi:hypothetical protein GXP71_14955 [Cellulomonas sp. H30R-01]|uniref:hypothetical protein n=1 Tax=Cellulomonas sp. H30R-01 TaxID=2704467 RepID=UPI00138CE87B|nr:hypothetical protein [Cellulomonas sp. H30R-01]QHT57246.1 hypothetical protein GXP71_14955 [Cellulomonas sp. H30R-01]
MKVVDHEPSSWFLLESDGSLLLDVHVNQGPVSGSLLVALTDGEQDAYEHQGRTALTRLAARVQDSAPLAAASTSPYRSRDLTRVLGADVTAAVVAWRAGVDGGTVAGA